LDLLDIHANVCDLTAIVLINVRKLLEDLGFNNCHKMDHNLHLRNTKSRLKQLHRVWLAQQTLIESLHGTDELLFALHTGFFAHLLNVLHQRLVLIEA